MNPRTLRRNGSERGGAPLEIKIVVDSQNQIFLIAEDGSNVLGGFGAVAVTPVIKAISMNKHGDDDPPGDDHGQDNDDLADFNEDLNDDHPNATFSLTFLSGELSPVTSPLDTARFWATSPLGV